MSPFIQKNGGAFYYKKVEPLFVEKVKVIWASKIVINIDIQEALIEKQSFSALLESVS